jgi:hypothetical protein
MLTAILKAVKMLLFCCTKNSQDAVVLAPLKTVQDTEKNHPTKTKYRDLFPSEVAIVISLLGDQFWLVQIVVTQSRGKPVDHLSSQQIWLIVGSRRR